MEALVVEHAEDEEARFAAERARGAGTTSWLGWIVRHTRASASRSTSRWTARASTSSTPETGVRVGDGDLRPRGMPFAPFRSTITPVRVTAGPEGDDVMAGRAVPLLRRQDVRSQREALDRHRAEGAARRRLQDREHGHLGAVRR